MSPKLLWLAIFLLSSLSVIVKGQYGNYGQGYGGQQPIIICKNRDNDGLRDIWPLLLILLFSDGFGGCGGGFGGYGDGYGYGGYGGGGGCCNCGCNNGGCCSGCCNTIPVPYPIPIPCNNPIIT